MKERSSRREFLKGRSLVRATREALENIEFNVPDLDADAPETRHAMWLETYEKQAMACTWEIMFNMHQHPRAGVVVGEAMELIDRLEQQLTIYRDDSEVSGVNRDAFDHSVGVASNLFGLFQKAQEVFQQTGGAFDITSGQLSSLWGLERREGKVPTEEAIAETLAKVGMQHVSLEPADSLVRFAVEGVKLNLGGIGKGYAIDRVGKLFDEAEIADYVIHGGQSSVLARGAQTSLDREASEADDCWRIGLRHPTLPDRKLAEFRLRDSALGTSGTGRQGFIHMGKRYGHIIDPKSGWPTDHFLSTTVISPSAAQCDSLATAFFVMPIEEVEAYCREHPEVAAVLVSRGGSDEGQVQLEWFNLEDDQWDRM